MKIIVATNNPEKSKEIYKILDNPDCEVITVREAGLKSDPEETENTFLGNAKIKAYAAYKEIQKQIKNGRKELVDYCVVADDSGLCVDALDGEPGVYSARYSGEDSTYTKNNIKLLEKLKNVPDEKRTARFETDVVFFFPDGKEIFTKGICEGKIADKFYGSGGFGYDPLFLPKIYDYKISMAQLSSDGKNEISHRYYALKALKEKLNI